MSEDAFGVRNDAARFAVIYDCVLFDERLGSSAKVLYAVLQRFSFKYGEDHIYPTIAYLAKVARMNRDTASAALKELEECGYIERQARGFGEAALIVLLAPQAMPDAEIFGAENSRMRKTPVCGNLPHAEKSGTNKERNSRNTKNVPPPTPPSAPYAFFAAVCEEAHLDPRGYSQQELPRYLKVAKRLIEAGVSEAEIRGVTRYLKSQRWRTTPITLHTVDKELGNWRAMGRPTSEPAPLRVKTQADHNSASQRKAIY